MGFLDQYWAAAQSSLASDGGYPGAPDGMPGSIDPSQIGAINPFGANGHLDLQKELSATNYGGRYNVSAADGGGYNLYDPSGNRAIGSPYFQYDQSGRYTGQRNFQSGDDALSPLIDAGTMAALAYAGGEAAFGGAGAGGGAASGLGGTGGAGAAGYTPFEEGFVGSPFAEGEGALGGASAVSGMDLAGDGAAGMATDSAATAFGGGAAGSGAMSQADIEALMRGGEVAGGAGGLAGFLQSPAGLTALTTALGGGLSLASGSKMAGKVDSLIDKSDPFAQYRPGYGQMLLSQMTNPDVSKLPGYDAGLQAVQRAGAAQGFTGSGNMATSLLKYGGDFWQQQIQNLAGFAGANITPNYGPYLNALGGAEVSQNAGIVNLVKGIAPMIQQGQGAYSGGGGGAQPSMGGQAYPF